MTMETKVCKRDGAVKPVTEFWKSKTTRDGLQSWCKECMTEYKRENKRARQIYLGGVKLCKKCREIKPKTEFNACHAHKDGLQSYCKKCDREHGRLRNGTTGEYRQPDKVKNAAAEQISLDFGKDLSAFTLRQLLDELKRRGYTGELTRTDTVKI